MNIVSETTIADLNVKQLAVVRYRSWFSPLFSHLRRHAVTAEEILDVLVKKGIISQEEYAGAAEKDRLKPRRNAATAVGTRRSRRKSERNP